MVMSRKGKNGRYWCDSDCLNWKSLGIYSHSVAVAQMILYRNFVILSQIRTSAKHDLASFPGPTKERAWYTLLMHVWSLW